MRSLANGHQPTQIQTVGQLRRFHIHAKQNSFTQFRIGGTPCAIRACYREEIDRPCPAIQLTGQGRTGEGVGANRGEELYRPEASDTALPNQFNFF